MSSSCPDCPAPVITLAPVAALSDELRNARHFMAWSVMEGCAARTLADTGADTNFVSQDFVKKYGLVTTGCKPRAIRLGNNSLHHINTCVVAETYIGQMKFKVSYLVMPLAHGIDSVLGVSFFESERCILDPEVRTLTFKPKGDRTTVETVACMPLLSLAPNLTENDGAKYVKHSQKESADVPLGLFSLSDEIAADDSTTQDEVASVSTKMMQSMLALMRKGKLTPDRAHAMLEGKKVPLSAQKGMQSRHESPKSDNSGQTFPIRRRGNEAESDMLLADIHAASKAAHNQDPDEEIYLVQLTSRPDGTVAFTDAQGKPIEAPEVGDGTAVV
eukprot:SAG11_NODE_3046_length_2733_cov_3.739939_4_plen_331_part_00